MTREAILQYIDKATKQSMKRCNRAELTAKKAETMEDYFLAIGKVKVEIGVQKALLDLRYEILGAKYNEVGTTQEPGNIITVSSDGKHKHIHSTPRVT